MGALLLDYVGAPIALMLLVLPGVILVRIVNFGVRYLGWKYFGKAWLLREELIQLGALDQKTSMYREDVTARYSKGDIECNLREIRNRRKLGSRAVARISYKR